MIKFLLIVLVWQQKVQRGKGEINYLIIFNYCWVLILVIILCTIDVVKSNSIEYFLISMQSLRGILH